MKIIKNNPYRVVGLLVGASAKEQDRQIRRLKQYIDAEQTPQDDYSFPKLGKFSRTLEKVNNAATKLTLDIDRINAALFWFLNGNPITDEPAFDLLKEGKIKEAVSIWSKLTNDKEVDKRNISAFHNLSTLILNSAIVETGIKYELIETGIRLKLKFLESDFFNELIVIATDQTFKITKKELQLIFLRQIQLEIDVFGGININKYLEIVNKHQFVAKQEFLKELIHKPIELIEIIIADTKAKRKANKANGITIGQTLFEQSSESLFLLKSILGSSNLNFSTISDKVSDEVLQCGIDYFSYFKNSNTDPSNASMNLFRKASTIAIGNIVKQRCQENTQNLQEWIDDKPERDKQKRIKEELDFITSEIESFQRLKDTISNAKTFAEKCKTMLIKIKSILGAKDELYLDLSNAVVQNSQNMLVQAVNDILANKSTNKVNILGYNNSNIPFSIKEALELSFYLGGFDMLQSLRTHYNNNISSLKEIAKQLNISTLSKKEILQTEIRQAEEKLVSIQNQEFGKPILQNAYIELNRIKEWKLGRSQREREKQIEYQEQTIKNLISKYYQEKSIQIAQQESIVRNLKIQLTEIPY